MTARDEVKKLLKQSAGSGREMAASLGNPAGQVAIATGSYICYATTIAGQVVKVFNDKVPMRLRYPVWIGTVPNDAYNLRVLRVRDVYAQPLPQFPPNMSQVLGVGGDDPLPITAEMITPWLVRWSGVGLIVQIYGMAYLTPAGYAAPLITAYDMAVHVPGTTGSRWVLVCVNSSGVITYTDGAIVALLTLADIPATPVNSMALSAVRLDYGQTTLTLSTISTSFLDLRYSGENTVPTPATMVYFEDVLISLDDDTVYL